MPVVGYNKVSNGAETSSPCQERRSVFSVLFFNWITETFKTGNSRHLEESDLLPIEEQNKTKVLTEKLQEIWNDEREVRQKCGKRPRLWRCVLKMLPTTEVFILLVLGLVDTMFCILRPLLLGVILSNLINTHSQDKKMMYACAVLLGVVSVGRSFATHLQCWLAEVQGARLCSALKGIIYSKITRVEHQTLQQFREGQVIDLLSNDLQRLELAPRYFFDMIAMTYFIPLVVYLFLNLFDWRALAGILFLLVIVLYFLFVSCLVGKLRWQTAHVTDKRIALMNELVSGIRAVKTHAWEQNYEERVKEIRRQEISKIRQKSLLVSTVEAIICCSSSIAVFLSVLFLVLSDRRLTPVNAFMLLSFMNLFRVIVSTYLGKGLQVAFEAVVSLGRMRDFLLLEDLPSSSKGSNPFKSLSKDDTTLSSNGDISERKARDPLRINQSGKNNGKNYDQEEIIGYEDSENALVVSNLSYKMNTGAENKRLLDDISFVTPRNSLTIICGQVGSGKSTLLSAIAGGVILSDGAGRFPGTLAYVPQVPWLFSGTIKENILFNLPFDPQWYFTVVEACGLREDIQLFPDEDDTIVGQRGAVLSGGQKARVSLARAVYSFADVYILDDPLSAVDQKVGDHIFERCICDLLDKKIRVLASHHSSHLQKADQVIVLSNGRVQQKVKPQLRRTRGREEVLSNTSVGEYQIKKDSRSSQSSSDKPNGLEIPEEDREIGNVSFRLYWDYFKSGMHPVFIVALITFFLLTQPAVVFPDVWLSYLSKQTLEQQQKMDNIVIYTSATAVSFGLAAIRVFLFFLASLRSSQQLHNKMVKAILHCQLLFFDTNPTGRILNRFSKDIGSMDEQLPQSFVLCIQFTLLVVTAVLLPAITNPWLLLVLLPTLAVFFLFTRYYLKTSRELKRLESICRSPVFSHFSETMAGLDTIRTRAMEDVFIEQFYRHQDLHNQAFYMVFESTRWFGLRVDLLCVPFVTCAALASVVLSMDPALAGLSLTYVMETVVSTQFTVRQFSDVENLMTSVERVMTYTNLESEPGYKTSSRPSIHWPRDGDVIFRDVTMTYYEGGPQVLRNVNFKLEGESRIGVAGRTGAGKSSLVAALLRMPDVQGDIIIDGVRISDINLQESRRCIAFLGQVPVLFSGSLRRNLDPMNQHEDVHLWAALEDVRLKSFVENLHGQLNYELLERGANLSVGERQLVCLARILLKHNRIVILDEPTAHVDPVTEKTIWNTVHEKLKNCTVITIAHRLDTIKDCDMILVLRDGEVAEFGTFDSLVSREDGVLAGIANIPKYEKEKE